TNSSRPPSTDPPTVKRRPPRSASGLSWTHNRTGYFRSIRLSSDLSPFGLPCRPSRMDGRMAFPAKDQGLPPPGCHLALPGRDFPLPLDFEVCQFSDVVDLHIVRTLADFAPIRKKALEQLHALR